ncbi:hypothetical protein LVY75_16590 [Sinorhizobium sp. B11]|jgi:hypothetical protein|uniref:hypothetical protein n=1 Tax=Rhizobium sp. BK512 TaxID=2587010 RepID=UPI0016212D4F|nr:hypothetical protein [Rhizobium sp. BK512]MBB3564170.1 hypothetical protein [Rhizobium sp. BK512]
MNRFRTFIVAGALITLSAVASGCTSTEKYGYGEDTSFNPACAGGFRPSDNRPCSY